MLLTFESSSFGKHVFSPQQQFKVFSFILPSFHSPYPAHPGYNSVFMLIEVITDPVFILAFSTHRFPYCYKSKKSRTHAGESRVTGVTRTLVLNSLATEMESICLNFHILFGKLGVKVHSFSCHASVNRKVLTNKS